MNRRKAIAGIFLATTGTILAIGGYKWRNLNVHPDTNFLDRKKALLAALADAIIPPTATPGASQADVHSFIILMLKDCTDIHTLNKFINGLQDLEDYCLSTYKAPFDRCPPSAQKAVLEHFEKRDRPFNGIWGKASARYLGKPFFVTLKEYTAIGYCSSEKGASQALAYVAIPGAYHGCIPLHAGQPAWATK